MNPKTAEREREQHVESGWKSTWTTQRQKAAQNLGRQDDKVQNKAQNLGCQVLRHLTWEAGLHPGRGV